MRDKKEFIKMSKSSFISRLRSIKDSIIHGEPHYKMGELVEENWFTWLAKNISHLGNSHYDYPKYTNPAINNGIFKVQGAPSRPVTIALLSDWASDTPESHLVAAQCGTQDYSIHLGDTYYVGNDKEIAYNFKRNKGAWPYGSSGSFAMLGNHEMYSSGKSYFTQLLPFMGAYSGNAVKPIQAQQASYFCLENDHWRIIGLDTGYWSLKGWLGLNPNTDLDLHEEQKAWLADVVKLKADKKGLIFLSHHQPFSAFETEFPNPQQTISNLLGGESDRDILWLWGHEHWFSVYGPNLLPNGSRVFARCIGNSGMPVELDVKKAAKGPKATLPDDPANRNLVLYDKREREALGDIPLGYNGFVLLNLDNDQLKISYYDDNDKQEQPALMLEEQWTINTLTGKLTGVNITDHTLVRAKKLSLVVPDIHAAII